MKGLMGMQNIDLGELEKDEYSTEFTLFMYNEYGNIDLTF